VCEILQTMRMKSSKHLLKFSNEVIYLISEISMCITHFYLRQTSNPGPDEPDKSTDFEYAAAYGCISDTKENLKELKFNGCEKTEGMVASSDKEMHQVCLCSSNECNKNFKPSFGKILRKLNVTCGQKLYSIYLEPEGKTDDANLTVVGNFIVAVSIVFVGLIYCVIFQ